MMNKTRFKRVKMKMLLSICMMLLLVGCDLYKKPESSKEEKAYISKYGATDRYYCENGFLMFETFSSYDNAPARRVVRNDAETPTRCDNNNTAIQVKETVATGVLSGSIK
ncbi:hypothetical protein [Aquamicrobium sp.]|uniref:hypothetical protein n=1 Tax=Aquamicrobium sp. TaxID=1872579 RepID=UPI002582AA5F|nr:hypothetical protein [Aquamicrobium sp.]MCK9549305.1 hypothetical protein [Aquamicrobium sp.]